MALSINIDGEFFPVTRPWYVSVIKPNLDFASWDHDKLELERSRLLLLSENGPSSVAQGISETQWIEAFKHNQQRFGDAERLRLANVTHVINAHRATRWLQGRPYQDFGFTGVDQVHGNACEHSCGCKTQHCFDHHKREGPPEGIITYPHFPQIACGKHKVFLFRDGLQVFHDKVHFDNRNQPKITVFEDTHFANAA